MNKIEVVEALLGAYIWVHRMLRRNIWYRWVHRDAIADLNKEVETLWAIHSNFVELDKALKEQNNDN